MNIFWRGKKLYSSEYVLFLLDLEKSEKEELLQIYV